jgi:hypothetical protein
VRRHWAHRARLIICYHGIFRSTRSGMIPCAASEDMTSLARSRRGYQAGRRCELLPAFQHCASMICVIVPTSRSCRLSSIGFVFFAIWRRAPSFGSQLKSA